MAAPRPHKEQPSTPQKVVRVSSDASEVLLPMPPRRPRGDGLLFEVSFESPEDMERNLQAKVAQTLHGALVTRGLQKEELGESVMTIKDRRGRAYHTRSSFEKAFPGGPGPDAFPMSVSLEYPTRNVVVVQVTLDGKDWEEHVADALTEARRARAAELRCALGDEAVSIALIDSSGQRFASKEDLEAAYEEQEFPPEDAYPMSLQVAYDRKVHDNSASSGQSQFNVVSKWKFLGRLAGEWVQKEPEVVVINGNMLQWDNSNGKRGDCRVPVEPEGDGIGDAASFVMRTPTGRWARATLRKGAAPHDVSQDELRWDDGEVWTRVVRCRHGGRRPSKQWLLSQEIKMQQSRFSSVSKVAVALVLTCLFMAAWAGGIAIDALKEQDDHRLSQEEDANLTHQQGSPSPAPTAPPARTPTPAAPDLPAEVRELKERLAAAERQRALAQSAAEEARQQAQAARKEANETAREADQRVRQADEEATAAKRAAEAAKARYVQSNTGRLTCFLEWLGQLPLQGGIALAAGTAGLLAVVGPSSFARLFLAIWGSAAAALLAGAAAALLVDRMAGGESLGSFTDAVMAIAQGGEGRGSDLVGCLTWLVLTVLGIARWATGFECALYEIMEEVKMDADGTLLIDDRDNLRTALLDEVRNGRRGDR